MTDKIDNCGSQSGIGCTDHGTYFSVYYSCTKPFHIVGDTDDVQISEYQCPSYEDINENWPTVWTGTMERMWMPVHQEFTEENLLSGAQRIIL